MYVHPKTGFWNTLYFLMLISSLTLSCNCYVYNLELSLAENKIKSNANAISNFQPDFRSGDWLESHTMYNWTASKFKIQYSAGTAMYVWSWKRIYIWTLGFFSCKIGISILALLIKCKLSSVLKYFNLINWNTSHTNKNPNERTHVSVLFFLKLKNNK